MSNDVKIEYYGDTSKYERATREVQRQTRAAANDIQKVWTGVGAVIAGIWGAGQAVSAMKDWAHEAGIAQQSLAGLKQSMVSMGRYSPEFFESMTRSARGLQDLTTFGDDATISGQKFLMTYREIPDSLMPRASAAMLDMAALMGGDTAQAANMLGKAAMGLSGELRRVGITIDPVIAKSGDFSKILTEIEKQVGGQAQALAETGIGQWQQMANLWGDSKEALGELVLSITDGMNPAIKDWIEGVRILAEEWGRFIKGPSSAEILRRQAAGIEAEIARMQNQMQNAAYFVGAGNADSYAGYAKGEIEKLQKQLAIVRGSLANEAAGIYDQGHKGSAGAGIANDVITADVQAIIDKYELEFRTKAREISPLEIMLLSGGPADADAIRKAVEESEAFEFVKTQQTDLELFMMGSYQRLSDMETSRRTREMSELTESTEFKKTLLQNEHDFALSLINERTMATIEAEDRMRGYKIDAAANTFSILKNLATTYLAFTDQNNELMFNLVKAAAIAEGLVHTYSAGLEAYDSAPYPYNIIAMAAIIAGGLAVVANISSTKLGGGKGGAGGGAAVPTYPANPTTGLPETGAQQSQQQVIVHIHGDYIDSEEHTATLAERLTEYVQTKRGYLVASNSEQ